MSQDTRNEEGRIIGGQFLVQGDEELVFGLRTVECIDQNSEMSVRLTFVSRSALEQLGVAIRIQKDVKRAGALLHKNITRVLGFGKDGDQLFIVEEQTSGFRLSHLLNRRSETERPFELKQAFYLTIHLCNALSNATDKLAHGLLAPSNVFIRKDGRPKVSGFGTGALLPIVVEGEGVTDWDRACLAPHLDSPGKRDLFALGRLFYALLKNSVDTRTSFAEQVESDDELSPSLMRLLLRCAGEGDVKPLSGPSEFREELHHVVSELFENETTKRRREPSVGPPPMPSELDLDLAAKPPGVDLRRRGVGVDQVSGMNELRWMYLVDGNEFGPVSGSQIVAKLKAGELTAYALIKDVDSGLTKPMTEHSSFGAVTREWASEASVREARLKEIEEQETARRLKRRGIVFALVLVIGGAFVYGGIEVVRHFRPKPLQLDIDGLLTYELPKLDVPAPVESDPEFKEQLAAYEAIMAKRPKKRRNAFGKKFTGTSMVDFSKSADSQGQVEEEMTRRLYASLSRHSGLLTCLQSALPKGTTRRSFNVQVTVLPNGALTEIRLPGAGISVTQCVRNTLSTYKVRSIKGVTVTATLPFTVQR